jgi:hypothetical protein
MILCFLKLPFADPFVFGGIHVRGVKIEFRKIESRTTADILCTQCGLNLLVGFSLAALASTGSRSPRGYLVILPSAFNEKIRSAATKV